MSVSLYPYQAEFKRELYSAIAGGCRRIVGQAPTGYGKTVLAAAIAQDAIDRGKRMIFVVPFLTLINQTVKMLVDNDIPADKIGVIQAKHELTDPNRPIQIASVQTLQKRDLRPANIVLIDEVHRLFKFYDKWLKDPDWADIPFIGLSATPWTRGLGKRFYKLIIGATIQELIDRRRLSKFEVWVPSTPDLEGIKVVAGDYEEGQLSEVMSQPTLVADVVDNWLQHGQNLPTLVFAVDRVHAKTLQKKFQEADVPTGYIDCYTPAAEREEIAEQFKSGTLKVVCNVGCLTTGVDWDVRCIVLARPTKSEMLFVQMIGRGLRIADGKDHCVIFDHSDNHARLGLVTDIHYTTLDDGKANRQAKPKAIEKLPKVCPKCKFLKPPKVLVCPACGFKPEPKCQVVEKDGELVEWQNRHTSVVPSHEDKVTHYRELKGFADEQTAKRIAAGRPPYSPYWPAMNFKEMYGHSPPHSWNSFGALEPSRKTRNWIKSKQIAFAKRRGAAA
jgi:DNA repair protein RadD